MARTAHFSAPRRLAAAFRALADPPGFGPTTTIVERHGDYHGYHGCGKRGYAKSLGELRSGVAGVLIHGPDNKSARPARRP